MSVAVGRIGHVRDGGLGGLAFSARRPQAHVGLG